MKRFLLFLYAGISSWALDFQTAVDLALQRSDGIKERDALVNQSKALYQSSYSPMMPSLDLGYIFSFNIPSTLASSYMLNSFNVRFSYNLFNGFRDYYAILNSKESRKRAEISLKDKYAEVALNAKNAYIGVLQNRSMVEILQERQRNIQAQKDRAQQFVNQGIRAKNEVLSMDIALSNTNLSLQSARLGLDFYLKSLEQILKMPLKSEDLQDIKAESKELNSDEIFQEALQKNTQYLNLLSLLDSAKYTRKQTMGSFLPRVDLSGVKYWYLDGFSAASTNYGLQSQIHLNFSWNLFNGLGDSYRFQAARYNEFSLISRIEAFKRDLKIQIESLVRQYHLAKKQYDISLKTLKKAKENYDITNNRYTHGIGTYTELINAELLLANSRLNSAQAKYGMASSLAQLDYLLNVW